MKPFLSIFPLWFVVFIIVCPIQLRAQHQELNEKPAIWKTDTAQLERHAYRNLFKEANFSGHFRYMFMATQNEKELSNYYANAIGGGLRMETKPWYGFSMAVSGFYSFNIGSSNFTQLDSLTGQRNRYEIGLFDITDPTNKKNIDRLEELYLRYDRGAWKWIFGKQLINTPFINLQDGRMRPTGVNGLYIEHKGKRASRWEGFLLNGISPRSTTKWYSIGESVGLYAQGVNSDGSKSNYAHHVPSQFIAMIAWHQSFKKNWQLQYWNLYTDRLMYSGYLQVDKYWKKPFGMWQLSAQGIKQFALSQFDKVTLPGQYYIEPHAQSLTYGIQMAFHRKQQHWFVQYNRITAQGRYLMPREWGRDPFFTFLPRERNEGLGDVHAWMVRYQYQIQHKPWQIQSALGLYKLPSPLNYSLNKYGMPSYWQALIDWRYRFSGRFQGLEWQTLLTAKFGLQPQLPLQHVINKVNLLHVTSSVNYRF